MSFKDFQFINFNFKCRYENVKKKNQSSIDVKYLYPLQIKSLFDYNDTVYNMILD